MKVSQLKLDETMIEFYNNDVADTNYKCFELMFCKLLNKLIKA